MANKKNLYKDDSIKSLAPREFVRLRPSVYCGSTEYATQLLIEVFQNSVDEYAIGHTTEISVIIDEDLVILKDNGQGIKYLIREDGKSTLQAVFDTLNTSGKYDDDGVYRGTVSGLNGIGNKLVTFLSSLVNVQSKNNGVKESLTFKDGILEADKTKVEKLVGDKKNETGLQVMWRPDPQFFTSTLVEEDRIKRLFFTTSCLCPGLKIILNYNGKVTEYYNPAGLTKYIDEFKKGEEIVKNRFLFSLKDKQNEMQAVLTYCDNYSSTIVPYVNTGFTESGPHITRVKTIITRELNKFFKEKGWLKEKDSALTGDDCQEGMFIIFNINAQKVQYSAQIKNNVTKIDMEPFSKAFAEEFQNWLRYNEKDIKKIADKAINARKAREAARKAKDKVRETSTSKGKKSLKDKMALSNKFVDCVSTNPKERHLMLVEG